MNKNNRLKTWRIVKQLSATFLFGAIVITSCKKEDSPIGGSINPNGLNVITTDTFMVKTYSDELDSLESDETSISLLGGYNDPEFGFVDCGIATQIRLSSEAPNFGTGVIVDSVVLSFVYTGLRYYGNSTENLTFEVYEIADDLVRDDQEYYTLTAINQTGLNLVLPGSEVISPKVYDSSYVGSENITPQLRINLNTTFGDDLIASNQMATNDLFTTDFKGLYVKVINTSILVPGKGNVLYLSLEDALSKMVIYYSNDDSAGKTFSFNINSKCARFNKIDFDRTGTDVEAVLNDPTLGQEKFYMQSSSVRCEITFPHIMDLNTGNKRIINKAMLILPVQDFQADVFDPTTSLFIARVKDKFTSDFTKDYSSFSFVSYDEDNKEFRFLMTQEIQAILNEERENTAFRIYPGSFFGSSIERIIFSGANSSSKNKARLEITYTEY
jgi:hypothetical protein